MNNYVVGILSMFENELKLFKITADSAYEAVKKGMIEFCNSEAAKEAEYDYQISNDYPKDLVGLERAYEEIPFNVIQI